MTSSALTGSATAGRSESGRGAFLVPVKDDLGVDGGTFFGEFSPLLELLEFEPTEAAGPSVEEPDRVRVVASVTPA